MIHNHDRSGWFGASDTSTIMGNWETETFRKWWLEKLGLRENRFHTPAMSIGFWSASASRRWIGRYVFGGCACG